MGFATPHGSYHKGPKKNTRKRKFHKPTFEPPKDTKKVSGLSATDEAAIKVLAQMSDHDMTTFVQATAHPNPTDVVIVRGGNGKPKPIVLDDSDARNTHSGMVYMCGIGGFGGGSAPHHVPESNPPIVAVAAIPTPKVVKPTKAVETEGEIVGYLVKKPNGEIVLKWKG